MSGCVRANEFRSAGWYFWVGLNDRYQGLPGAETRASLVRYPTTGDEIGG